ncbi:hypothetical protein GCM10022214_38920 [Actinomadura miaoliensis]|uniref:DUF397 domain-containing protein n=1 Tax=Actinomadura miaoliensis TaxID=430685 RepID=A0ABP7VYW4_9ACTN
MTVRDGGGQAEDDAASPLGKRKDSVTLTAAAGPSGPIRRTFGPYLAAVWRSRVKGGGSDRRERVPWESPT